MITSPFEYAAPETLQQAVSLLAERAGAVVLAGGLSLLTSVKTGRAAPSLAVDLRKLGALRGIARRDGWLHVGTMTAWAEIAVDPEVRRACAVLADAAEGLGDPQVRNRGTIGGNVCTTDAPSDGSAACLALNAVLIAVGPNGRREIGAEAFYAAGTPPLERGEIVTGIDIPAAHNRAGSAYEKFRHPASGYAICGVAAFLAEGADGLISACRVAVTGAADRPVRLSRVEDAVQGQKASAERFTAAARAVGDESLTFVGDLAASADYRKHLAGVLAERALVRAHTRMLQPGT